MLNGADRFAGAMDVGPDARAIVGEPCSGFAGTSPDGRTGDVVGAATVVAVAEGIARAGDLEYFTRPARHRGACRPAWSQLLVMANKPSGSPSGPERA